MSNLSDYIENKIADDLFGRTSYTIPSTFYLALYTVAPTDTGGGTEATGGSYARVTVTNNTTNFPSAVGGLKKLATEAVFPTATGSWGTIVAVGLLDAASGGNLVLHGTLTASRTIATGDSPKFAADTLTVQFD
tara:strand:- start:11360 stop:11761 length:402 start_codon:yes stop_codon:yes gene_type:complete